LPLPLSRKLLTLWPFPSQAINAYINKVKGILVVELNAGQMIEDVRLAVECKIPVTFCGRLGGIVPAPQEVLKALINQCETIEGPTAK
jgi:2-oxoglutarate ferredoxin oxidoreductase subunit alpha